MRNLCRCACLRPVSEEPVDGEDLYPVPGQNQQKQQRKQGGEDGRKRGKGGKARPNPFAGDPMPGSRLFRVLKDVAPLHTAAVRVGVKYHLGRELGRGEFGITPLRTDTAFGEAFACKSISKEKLRTSVDVVDVRLTATVVPGGELEGEGGVLGGADVVMGGEEGRPVL